MGSPTHNPSEEIADPAPATPLPICECGHCPPVCQLCAAWSVCCKKIRNATEECSKQGLYQSKCEIIVNRPNYYCMKNSYFRSKKVSKPITVLKKTVGHHKVSAHKTLIWAPAPLICLFVLMLVMFDSSRHSDVCKYSPTPLPSCEC